MKTARIAACVAGAGALIGLAGCCSLFWHPGCAPKIVTQPKSQLIKKGSPVTFSVTTYPTTNVYYQWRFNNVDIAGANTSSYTIPSVDFINVGAYDVLVWGSPTNTSKPAYLSVYTLTSGSGGTLATPIGAYSSQSFTCPSGGTFNKGFCVTNNQGTPAFFYGPNASPQSDPFQNTSRSPTLTVDTFSTDNGTADTGIRIQNNWVPLATACCNDNATGGTDSKQSQCTITLSQNTGSYQNSYRLVLFYKDPPPPTSGRLTFNWLYH